MSSSPTSSAAEMTLKMAREVLGVSSLSTPAEIQRAYRQACKRAHPDRGGDERAFHQVTEAYRCLTQPAPPPPRPAPRRADPPVDDRLTITPDLAVNGGMARHCLTDGRRLKIKVPPGLRNGDHVRAGDLKLEIYIRADAGVLVRGSDIWISAHVGPNILKRGGRIVVDTPHGRKAAWVTPKGAEHGLVKMDGLGLPPQGRHPAGHLYIRLAQTSAANGNGDGLAASLLRKFAAAWAA